VYGPAAGRPTIPGATRRSLPGAGTAGRATGAPGGMEAVASVAMPEATPERTLDEKLVRRLLAEKFPGLEIASLAPFAEGFDNVIWLVNGEQVFRFPRREAALPGVAREIALLAHLAALVPVPVPRPEWVGRPSERFPWPFFGGRLLPGRESSEAGLEAEARAALAEPLGRFLRALHSPATLAGLPGAEALPYDPAGRSDMNLRVRRARAAFGDLQRLRLWSPTSTVLEQLALARGLPAPQERVLVHGDLHFRHLLVEGRSLTRVIDWGDLCLGAPAMDLQIAGSFFPPGVPPGLPGRLRAGLRGRITPRPGSSPTTSTPCSPCTGTGRATGSSATRQWRQYGGQPRAPELRRRSPEGPGAGGPAPGAPAPPGVNPPGGAAPTKPAIELICTRWPVVGAWTIRPPPIYMPTW
jgi:aminoglycoside phosphotransferase (APT) family kinase protein